MKIAYKKNVLNMHLIIALLFIAIFILQFFIQEKIQQSILVYFLFAFLYTFHYLRQQKHGYLRIEDGVCYQYSFISKKSINLNEVKSLKYYAKNYTLRSVNEELIINEKFIDSENLARLLSELEKYHIVLDD